LELGYGILIGVCNVLGSGTFIVALDQLDALIAFPVSGSGGMLFTTTVGILILGEQLNKRLAVGVVLAIISLILVNLYF
jgi:multidrug transporter EmrE-like cation transporter